jgi:hypothetical protein
MQVTLRDVRWPYDGRPGASQVRLDDGVPPLRGTAYDLEAAAAELHASGYANAESMLAESLLDPVPPTRSRRTSNRRAEPLAEWRR